MRLVLTHGAMHGSWCWKYVLDGLAALGVPAIAPDLPGHGERTNEPATLDGYRKALLDVLEPDDVLVGLYRRSLGLYRDLAATMPDAFQLGEKPAGLLGREPVSESHTDSPHAFHAADPGRQLGAQETGVRRLVRDTPDGRKPKVDRG